MSLFVMADLHLSSDRSNSMEIFGPRWQDYMEKIQKNWNLVVSPEDTVIVPGDISWSLRLEDSLDDFRFLDGLNGKKLIGKGNHDFWWSTHSKLRTFWEQNQISSVDILYNNAHRFENCIVSGTRGWFVEENQQHTVGNVEHAKIVNREAIRLRLSLEEAVRLRGDDKDLPIVVFSTSLPFGTISFAGKFWTCFMSLRSKPAISGIFTAHIMPQEHRPLRGSTSPFAPRII